VTASDDQLQTIHVRLLDEGTSVWRPTKGRKVRGMTFEVLPTPNYDRDDESWEFLPGMLVEARHQRHGGEVLLEAWRRAPTYDRDETTDLAEWVARQVGASFRRTGGLRLIPHEHAHRFVAACAAQRLLITYAEAFDLLDGDPVSAEWGGADEFVRAGTGVQIEGQVEGFVERTALPGRWFDFVVHHHDGTPFPWRRAPCHVAPLPRPHSRLRLVEDDRIAQLRSALEPRDYESYVFVAEIARSESPIQPQRALRDLSVLGFGDSLPPYARVKRPDLFWQQVSPRERAIRALTTAIVQDLAYSSPRLEPAAAEAVASDFVRLFRADAAFFVNGSIREDDHLGGWDPLTSATLERAFGVFDAHLVGLLVVTGED
jgi:hypothetical protein